MQNYSAIAPSGGYAGYQQPHQAQQQQQQTYPNPGQPGIPRHGLAQGTPYSQPAYSQGYTSQALLHAQQAQHAQQAAAAQAQAQAQQQAIAQAREREILARQQQAARDAAIAEAHSRQQTAYLAAQQQHAASAQGHHAASAAREQDKRRTSQIALSADSEAVLRAAKKRRPTDRALPRFDAAKLAELDDGQDDSHSIFARQSDGHLAALSNAYDRLTDLERRLDWTLSRQRVELEEQRQLAGGALSLVPSLHRTLRIRISNSLQDQVWQIDDARLKAQAERAAESVAPPPAPMAVESETTDQAAENGAEASTEAAGKADDAPKPETASVSEEAKTGPAASDISKPKVEEVIPVDFSTQQGIPRWTLNIAGEVLTTSESGELSKDSTRHFSNLVSHITVDLDRREHLFNGSGRTEWARSSTRNPVDAVRVSRTGSEPCKARISLYLTPYPERVKVLPELARLINVYQDTRPNCLTALWLYVKSEGLPMPEDQRRIRLNEPLKRLFNESESIPFHFLQEFLNRYLSQCDPVILEYEVDVSDQHASKELTFDIPVEVENLAAKKVVVDVANDLDLKSVSSEAKVKEIIAMDEKIAMQAATAKAQKQKRDFAAAFASNPQQFMQDWIASQARDLDTLLAGDRGTGASLLGGSSHLAEARRRADFYKTDEIDDAINLHLRRRVRRTQG
ncbi:uncharacterized protein L969DRAFT_85307 [Mixia osmundae IAM 14324]|uniref:DM2 domain-containing protein n=1 Tax=Mixia osmundae (strain CBS 9802 / IAM 14324 / JCM 22182 / KY 12970) TaxID=764103 RepID=G7DYF6_MIXOS|nr:uncharacterized protein L969DRAFT_85307 [Mixia osmundae IAM 14324]KEI41518.1 hypothetical protein L969DRAFT_85307 [Mixia osmundae IAM 14324]GAA95616.1 hypothetical protein E5Q_02272 [Mixia osmundae IAM 14324]